MSAFIIAVAGSFYALNHQFISLDSVCRRGSEPVMMTLLGGAGAIFKPFLGAGIVIMLRESLSTITASGDLRYGESRVRGWN